MLNKKQTKNNAKSKGDVSPNLVLKAARDYKQRRGWKVVRVPPKQKNPVADNWQIEEIPLEDFGKTFGRWDNIGVQFGPVSNGLCDVDLDCREARELAPTFLPETQAKFGRESSPCSHWLYVSNVWETVKAATTAYDDPIKADDQHGARMIELRTGRKDHRGEVKGAQSMFPPSKHPSGEAVEWVEDGEPATVDGKDLKRAVAELAVATLMARHWPPKGKRNDAALILGGVLARHAGLDGEEIEVFVREVARVAGDDEWEKRGRDAKPAAQRLKVGDELRGFPTMQEMWGKEITDAVSKWLGAKGAAAVRPTQTDADEEEAEHEGADKKQADVLLDLASQAQLFKGDDDEAYADIIINGHREAWHIESKGFKDWLLYRYYKKVGSAPNAEPMRSALATLAARARFDHDTPKRKVSVRIGGEADKIYIDLADDQWRVVEIDADGWRVIDNAPVRFRRAPGMLPLPVPVKGGTVDALRPYVNIKPDADADFVLLVSWLIAGMRERGPYPILALIAEEGSAKSTLVLLLLALIDPNDAPLSALPKSLQDLSIAANNSHVLCFDNVSKLSDWLSDGLCRMSTGAGYRTRALFTNAEEIRFKAKRPILLNGREEFVTESDLADRCIFLRPQPIPDDARRDEAELWSAFAADRPGIFGALLDAVAHGLRELPDTKLDEKPRMADFALWATACEPGLGWKPGTFGIAYAGNRKQAVSDVIEGDTVAATLRSFMRKARPESGVETVLSGTQWSGTATGLLAALGNFVGKEKRKGREWPHAPGALRKRLQRMQAVLRKDRITIEFDRTKRARTITITSVSDDADDGRHQGDDARRKTTVIANPLKSHTNDGDDGDDGARSIPMSTGRKVIDEYRANVVAIGAARRKRMGNGGDA